MANRTKCILEDYRKDKCASCDHLCGHRIALHGLDGNGGRVGAAGLPKDYRYVTLANSPVRESQPEIYAALERYVETFGGGEAEPAHPIKSLYLWSVSPGTGKTTTASALLNAWIAQDYLGAIKRGEQPRQVSGVFFDVNEFQTEYNLATMTNDDDDAMKRIGGRIKRVQSAPFAVIDDIGVRDATQAFRSYIHAIINHRVTNGLPTVYTSNLAIKELAEVFDARLYDRIRDQCGVIHFAGESKRGRR